MMPKYAKLVHNEQKNKIFSKFHNLIRKIQRNIQNNIYNDIAKIKTDIQSIPNQCIEFIIKNKLILTDDLEKYNNMATCFKKINQDIPRHILFQFFPMVGAIENTIKGI